MSYKKEEIDRKTSLNQYSEKNEQLLKRYSTEGISNKEKREIEEELILLNRKLVHKCAKKFAIKKCQYFYDDLVSEGIGGLLSAIRTFKLSKNVTFSTYAVCCIKNSIGRSLENITDAPMGFSQRDKDFRTRFLKEKKRNATDSEVADNFGMTLNQYYNITYGPEALEEKIDINDEETTSLIHLIPDPDPTPEERAVSRETMNAFFDILKYMPETLKIMLYERFYNEKTYEEIAEEYNLTPQTVRQYIYNARQRLKAEYGNSEKMMEMISSKMNEHTREK